MASTIIRMPNDIPKVMKAPRQAKGRKCQTKGFCEHGGECFVDNDGNDQCVCPRYTSGKHCEFSHVFTVCNEPDQRQTYCRKGGTCMVNNLTGKKACLYDKDVINEELDVAASAGGKDQDYNTFKLKKLEVIEFASLIVLLAGIALIAVIAVIVYKRRQRACKEKKNPDAESNSSGSKKRRNSQTSNDEFQMVVDTKGQSRLLPQIKDQQLGSIEPLLASRSTNDLREKRCHSPVFRALPEGYVGSFEDINKRHRLHATYDDSQHCPRRVRSVDGRIGDEKKLDDLKLSPHALRRLRMNKSNTTGHYRARSPTISDVPSASVPVIVVEHREDCSETLQTEPSSS